MLISFQAALRENEDPILEGSGVPEGVPGVLVLLMRNKKILTLESGQE